MIIISSLKKRKHKTNSCYMAQYSVFYKEMGLQFDAYGNPVYSGMYTENGNVNTTSQQIKK